MRLTTTTGIIMPAASGRGRFVRLLLACRKLAIGESEIDFAPKDKAQQKKDIANLSSQVTRGKREGENMPLEFRRAAVWVPLANMEQGAEIPETAVIGEHANADGKTVPCALAYVLTRTAGDWPT